MTGLVTLSETKEFLELDPLVNRYDNELRRRINTSADVVEELVGPVRLRTLQVALPAGARRLALYPIVSITDTATSADLSGTTDLANGILLRPGLARTVTLTVGYANTTAGDYTLVPDAVKDAALTWISGMFRMQHGGSQTYTVPDGSSPGTPGMGALMFRVRACLSGKVQVRGIA